MPYSPALDGLRALAVLAVIAYHGDFAETPGGFLGVEVFFVISGYLVTALIDQELRVEGDLSLTSFWRRRFRRLVPGSWALIAATAAVTVTFYREDATRLAKSIPAALAYLSNWWFIFAKESYFEAAGRPPLLRHLWSLAIEAQFYLILPLLILGAAKMAMPRGRRALIALGGAFASLIWMAVSFVPFEDPSRVYFGTDTRAGGLLFGVALGTAWRPWLARRDEQPGRAMTIFGAVGLAGLLWAVLRVNDYDSFVYRGGFLLVDIFTLMLIMAAVHTSSPWRRWLGVEPLRQIGLRSYSLYLWHWPVFAFTRPQIDTPWGPVLTFVVRAAIVIPLAEVSYRYIETPFRRGVPQAWFAERKAQLAEGYPLERWELLGGAAVLAVLLGIGVGFTNAPGAAIDTSNVSAAPTTTAPATTSTSVALPLPVPTTTTTTAPPQADHYYFLGDSVMVGIKPMLLAKFPTAAVNAKVGRQFGEGESIVRFLESKSQLPTTRMVVMLGANGPIDERAVRDMVARTGPDRIYFVNVHTARRWGPPNTARLGALSAELGFKVIDWASLAKAHPEWFRDDGTHPSAPGRQALADLIASNIPPLP